MPGTRELVVGLFRLLLRTFFHRIEVAGLEHVPGDRGGLLVSWHPNGVIDGTVVGTTFPRRIVFGARHDLLRIPAFGWLLRQCGTVPIYRRQDATASEAERREANRRSVDTLARTVADGGFAALFPEGQSHDEPDIQHLKTGAARLYYRAVELTPRGATPPVIIPVALHYDRKSVWGSQVLVTYHRPLRLPPELAVPAGDEAARRRQAAELTAELDRVLREVILATESWELHHRFHRARALIRAEGVARSGGGSAPADIAERVRQFGRIWKNYHRALAAYPRETAKLFESVAFYDKCLRALGVEDHELDGSTWRLSRRRTLLLILVLLAVYLVLPFFLVIGVLVNLPTMLLLLALTKATARKSKDEASIKVFVGAVLFPLTWLLVAALVAWGGSVVAAGYPRMPYSPLLTGGVAFVLSAFGGVLALHFRQLALDLWRTVRVRLTLARRKHAIEWLLEERASLFERFLALDRKLGVPTG